LELTNDIYCDQILTGELPVEKILETDHVLAFYHTRPSWTHVIVIPKQHVTDLVGLQDKDLAIEIFQAIKDVIKKLNLPTTNYKVITNGGSFQESKHLHFHIVSGEQMKASWK
jgi:histidine triad (HIT) family protein